MPAAPVFLQLIADLVVYLGSVRPAEKGYSPLRISFCVGSSHCTKSAKWTRGESIPRRASGWLCSERFFNWSDALMVVQPQDVDSLASSRVWNFFGIGNQNRGALRFLLNSRRLIREMSRDNSRWGEERIANELPVKPWH